MSNQKDKEHIDYTIKTITLINELSDEIYESLMDREFEDLQDSISILIDKLKQLQDDTIPRIRFRGVPPRRD
jgi:uncharacterized coiled-coil protein SlyX